jgi:hypothetical protein
MLTTYKGKTKTTGEWAKTINLTYDGLRQRAIRSGGEYTPESVIKALDQEGDVRPPTNPGKEWTIQGETKTIRGWADALSSRLGYKIGAQALNNRARYRGGGQVTTESLTETIILYLKGTRGPYGAAAV